MGTMRVLPIVLLAFCSIADAANSPPVVDAGRDTTTRLGYRFSFYGAVTDDGLPNPSPVIWWTQVSGPLDGATIAAPDAEGSSLTFSQTGVYTFRLSANDGELTSTHDVVITVLDSIPFRVLTPVAGQQVAAGCSLFISWQVDPPGTNVVIDFSPDGGLSYSENLAGGRIRDSSWVWEVPANVAPSDQCQIRIREYFNKQRQAVSEFFSVTATSTVMHLRGRRSDFAPSAGAHSGPFLVDGRSLGARHVPTRAHGAAVTPQSGSGGRAVRQNL